MPLPAPILDDRTFEQLREELVRRIPVYAPEWTDHNASDPGIALLELFAFLGENLLFRFNQLPESTYLAFLRLLDVPVRPGVPARATVVFTPAKGAAPVPVDRSTALQAGDLGWETLDEVAVLAAEVRGVAKRASTLPEDSDEAELAWQTLDALGLEDPAGALFYEPQVLAPDPMVPGAEMLALPDAVDGTLWVAVLADSIGDVAGHALSLGFALDEDPGDSTERDPCPGPGEGRPAPAVVWQAASGVLAADGTPVYRTLQVIGDTTGGLTRDGVTRLRLPSTGLGRFPAADDELMGTGELPPELEDEELRERAVLWLRAFRPDGGRFRRMRWIGANAARVEQTRRALGELLGVGTGEPSQSHFLIHTPVVPASIAVDVEEDDGFVSWRRVDGFEGSDEDDSHFVLDPESGEVRFGNGVRGRMPALGRRIRTTGYRYGGGRAGNVAAKTIVGIDAAPVEVLNPLPARGGADPETVAEALERIPAELRRRDRAVTSSDFQELALATPGAAVGRAEALPLMHPRRPHADSAGVVSVVVWPREDGRRPSAPMPDRALLEAVCAQLDERRLLTTEVYVLPPTYRQVAVSVGLSVQPGYGVDAVRRWVELVIRQYLAPLPPHGPAGAGWPLGQRVHGPELEAAALQVEGVRFLEGLVVAERGPDGAWEPGTVILERHEVPDLASVTVVEGEPRPPGEDLGPVAPAHPPVPVPVIRHTC